jgi:hypothetical protein
MIAPNFIDACGSGRRAAMKHGHSVPLGLECRHKEPPDEAISSNQKEAHRTVNSSGERAPEKSLDEGTDSGS